MHSLIAHVHNDSARGHFRGGRLSRVPKPVLPPCKTTFQQQFPAGPLFTPYARLFFRHRVFLSVLIQGHAQCFKSSVRAVSVQGIQGTRCLFACSGGQSQYLPVETLLDFLQFNGLVAFVLFNKNNGKLISLPLSKGGKKNSENIILSNLPQRNFFPRLLSVQSCLRYESQYQSGNI